MKQQTYTLPIVTPDGIVSLEVIHTVLHPNEEDMRVTLCAVIHGKMRSYSSDTTEDALILLAKDLPEDWHMKSCFSCRYGHFCPVGDYDNELFCVTEFEPKNPRDLWHVTKDDSERKERSRTLFDLCERYLEQSEDYFTYSDYPFKRNTAQSPE